MPKRTPTHPAPVRWLQGEFTREEPALDLLVEEPLEIRLDGVAYSVIMRTPGDDLDLVAGFCFTEGLIRGVADVREIERCRDEGQGLRDNVLNVSLEPSALTEAPPRRARAYESRSSCGVCGTVMLEQIEQQIDPVGPGPRVSAGQLIEMQSRMRSAQPLFQATRGAHAAALFSADGDLREVREDVGRHNALDKLIGHCLRVGHDPSGDVLVLSSRASFELVQKAARAGIALIATVSTTTSLARELAEKLQCTLVAVLRDDEMMVHTHPRRVELGRRGEPVTADASVSILLPE